MTYSLLGSGSSGNATLLTHDRGAILVDCGYSYKGFLRRLHEVGFEKQVCVPKDIDAIFVTHEHSDHTRGLGVLTRRLDIPVYMTQGTKANLPDSVGVIPTVRTFRSGEVLEVGGFTVESFPTSHDAADPVGFTVCQNGTKLGILTDTGCATALTKTKLAGCNTLLLECNYDPDMMKESDYPSSLKKRIRSNTGHLSNRQSASLLKDLIHDELRTVVAMHISEKNNTPEKVREALGIVGRDEFQPQDSRTFTTPLLEVASQDVPTPLREV